MNAPTFTTNIEPLSEAARREEIRNAALRGLFLAAGSPRPGRPPAPGAAFNRNAKAFRESLIGVRVAASTAA